MLEVGIAVLGVSQSLGIGVLEEEEEEMECSGLPAECWNRRMRVPDYLSTGLPALERSVR